jgi:Domain of unknown function (DUF4136)
MQLNEGRSTMWQQSRNWMATFGPAFVLGLITCSVIYGQDIITNYLPGTDFSKYRTYKWVTIGPNGVPDQILDTQIKQSIDSQLAAKGFMKVEGDKADLFVRYQVAVDKERQWNATGMGDIFRSPGLSTAMGSATATSSTIDVGTLVLDMFDPSVKQLVWTGHATKTINPSKDPQKNQRNIDKAMQKLLKGFPPRQK